MENKELLGVGRTFILTVLFIVATVILILTGKIPTIISMGEWITFGAPILGIFAAKSVGHAVAGSKNPKTKE